MIRKTALIFGGSADIGKAVARKFAMNGYNLGLTYFNNDITDFASSLSKEFNIDIVTKKMDARAHQEVEEAILYFKKELKTIDVGICIFGIAEGEALIIDKNEEEIRNVVETNLIGTIFVNQELLKVFIENRRGVIVNTSSVIGNDGASCETVYSSTKAGIVAMTKSIAKEFGYLGIRANTVSPGFIDTKMCACFNDDEREVIRDKTVLERLGQVEDVAEAVYFLSTDQSSFITGENITVSGGLKL